MKGRKPKSPELKIAAGTTRKGRKRTPPRPKPGLVAPPEWLAGEALAEWKRVAPQLIALNVLTRLDRAAFVVYCQAWGDYTKAVATLAKEDATYKAGTLVKKHPAVGLAAEAARQVRLAGERFGLDPFARNRLNVDPRSAQAPEAKDAKQQRFFERK